MTKPVTKQGMIFELMNANADKPMEDVVALILKLEGVPGKALNESDVRSTYLWAIRTGKAKGIGKTAGAPRKPSVTRVAKEKVTKSKLVKVPKPRIAGDKEQAARAKLGKTKTVEEIADIRAKNLARLKAVGKKYAKGQYAEPDAPGVDNFDADEARAYVEAVTNDIDSFKSPSYLSMDEVKVLV